MRCINKTKVPINAHKNVVLSLDGSAAGGVIQGKK